jgi:hypothetical protein
MYNRTVTSILLAVALLLGLGPSASATDYGKPSGRWSEAIVEHEGGHCLGAWTHTASPHVMRPSLNPYRINSGLDPWLPTSTDKARLQASRANYTAGERATYYVPHPMVYDSVPVLNKTGRASAFTAIDRWDAGTDFTIWPTTSNLTYGIVIQWDWSLAGRSIGGTIRVDKWVWNGSFWQAQKCTVLLNPDVET